MADPPRRRLRPTKALVHDAVDATVALVAEGHDSTARTVVAAVSQVPGLAAPVEGVDAIRRVTTHGVLGTVRLVNRAVEAVSDAALDLAGVETPDPDAVPMHAATATSGLLDQAVGALNGAVGDHLASRGNGLDLGLRLRHGDAWLDLDDLHVPDARSRVVVLVHGLATTELCWTMDAGGALGGEQYGSLLARDLGFTPVYVRYNTGRPIQDNGEALARALQQLVQAWPEDVAELVLVGHSMGGLVSRVATSHAASRGLSWAGVLDAVVCLGSPHGGAPLARVGHQVAGMLHAVDLPATRIIGKVLRTRSAGVKDLRHHELRAMGPLLDGVRYLFVAGVVAGDLPAAQVLGDLIVPVDSAHGPDGDQVTLVQIPGVPHHRLQAHPAVYAALHDHLQSVLGG